VANIKFKDVRLTLFFKLDLVDRNLQLKFNSTKLTGFNDILKDNISCKRFNVEGNSILHSTLFNKLQDDSSEDFLDDMMEFCFTKFNKTELSSLLYSIYERQQSKKNSQEQVDSSFINTQGKIQSSKNVKELQDEIKNNKATFGLLLARNNGDKDLKFRLINDLMYEENEKYYLSLMSLKNEKILNTLKQENNEESTIKLHDMYLLQYFKNKTDYDVNYVAFSLKFKNFEFEYSAKNLIYLIEQFDDSEYIDEDNIVGKYIEIIDDKEQDHEEFINTLLEVKSKLKFTLKNFIPRQKSKNYQLYIDDKKNIGIENKFTQWDDKDLKTHIFALAIAYKSKYKELSEKLANDIHSCTYEELEDQAQTLLKFQGSYFFKNPTTYSVYNSFFEKLNIELSQDELEKRTESMKASLRIDYEKVEKKKQDRLNFLAVLFTIFGGLGFFLSFYDMFLK